LNQAILVVPCFNEAARLEPAALLSLVDGPPPGPGLLLVDDGSRDDTRARLYALAARAPDRVEVLALPENRGKGEAVRQGLRHALRTAGAPGVVGYFDADLSTPISELRRLLQVMAQSPAAEVVMGARISLLGSDIERSAVRHYLGRIFATFASLILQTRVYDTQCGAKLFRRSPALDAALAEPFLSRWAFDVELLGRLLAGGAATPPINQKSFVEVPLHAWRDVPGSKLNPPAMAGALKELPQIHIDLKRRRRQARTA
jgi:glycosyltransferase involved in cell wall biosynthesis